MIYDEVIRSLQNLGEVTIKLSMHSADLDDSGHNTFRQDKPVCFALDALKENPAKKAKKAGNFEYFEIESHFDHNHHYDFESQ